MRQKKLFANLVVLFATASLFGQNSIATTSVATEAPSKTSSSHATYYIDPVPLHLNLILSPPPARDSATTAAELTELHRIEAARTPAQIAQARTDDHEEDIFLFETVLGQGFTAEALPITASLSDNVRKEESAAGGLLKKLYHRPRPYQVDSTLHPVCPLNPEPTSYPSGHSLSGYLLAFTLVQLVPEKRQQILDRADDYVHNRLICGVHYASDVEASRRVAYAIFGAMEASPDFQRDLADAREETRRKLDLPLSAPQQ
ncbi:MAG TPA: phosphatase PAP2 family protein [Candidatus Sulfotelmatobacter sp.]